VDRDPAKLPPTPSSPTLRLLAPLALALFTVVLIVVVASSLGGGSDSDSERGGGGGGRGQAERSQSDNGGGGGGNRPPKRYEVQEGDSLSSIAERFNLSVDEINELNPDVDPQALSTGERLRLR
jgi:LysM repeat protein